VPQKTKEIEEHRLTLASMYGADWAVSLRKPKKNKELEQEREDLGEKVIS